MTTYRVGGLSGAVGTTGTEPANNVNNRRTTPRAIREESEIDFRTAAKLWALITVGLGHTCLRPDGPDHNDVETTCCTFEGIESGDMFT